jgi:hypothetical protein
MGTHIKNVSSLWREKLELLPTLTHHRNEGLYDALLTKYINTF